MLDVGCWMFAVGCWMLDVRCSMLDVRCWMFDVRCWMFELLHFVLQDFDLNTVMASWASFWTAGSLCVSSGSREGIVSLFPRTAKVRQASRTRCVLEFLRKGSTSG